MILNNKGFTLFTALISLILVSISLALVFNMIATEETYLNLIQDQASMSDLITIADLAKADAFNSFLISLRSKWEEYKSYENSTFKITREQVDMNWNDFVNSFVKSGFFEDNFAGHFAQSLLYNLKYKQNPPGYAITLNNNAWSLNSEGGSNQNTDFSAIIEQIFIDGGQKVDVVDCDQEGDYCTGSFYLTLDTTQLSDSNYEQLPIITILRYKTNQVIQRPILNRQVYKIYMPWRGFQAFRIARRMALGDAEKEAYPAISENYNGLFNPALHNTLEQARLGFCDPGTCSPRPGFFETPDTKGFNKKCNDVPSVDLAGTPNPALLNVGTITGHYDPKNAKEMEDAFEDFYNQIFEENIRKSAYGNTGLIMIGVPYKDINVLSINVFAEGPRTKQIIEEGSSSDIDIDEYNQMIFSTLSDISGPAGGLGLFLNDNKSQYIWGENNSWYKGHIKKYEEIGENESAPQLEFKCIELKSTDIYLKFVETNPRYYVKKEYLDSKDDTIPVQINVVLNDTYTQFFFPDSTQFWAGLSISGNYLSGDPTDLNENFETQWICSIPINGSKCGIKES